MKNEFNVAFSGLKVGEHLFEFELNQAFFDAFEVEQEFRKPKIKADVVLEKLSNHLELDVTIKGTIEVDCDLSNEAFDHPIQGKAHLIVKYGHEFDLTDDEIWVIPMKEYQLDIRQWLYEIVLINIPIKRINPALGDEDEIFDLLQKYQPKIEKKREENEGDPRWDALKNLDLDN